MATGLGALASLVGIVCWPECSKRGLCRALGWKPAAASAHGVRVATRCPVLRRALCSRLLSPILNAFVFELV